MTINANEIKQLNALTLAYVGDAVIELAVRERIVRRGRAVKPNILHRQSVQYVAARNQARILQRLREMELLTEEEARIVRRGKNARPHTIPKNTDPETYRYGTALEAVIGYHYLLGNERRLQELMKWVFQTVEDDDGGDRR